MLEKITRAGVNVNKCDGSEIVKAFIYLASHEMKFIQRKTNSKKYYTFFHKKNSCHHHHHYHHHHQFCWTSSATAALLNNTYPFPLLYVHKPLEAKLNDLTDSPFLALTARLNSTYFLFVIVPMPIYFPSVFIPLFSLHTNSHIQVYLQHSYLHQYLFLLQLYNNISPSFTNFVREGKTEGSQVHNFTIIPFHSHSYSNCNFFSLPKTITIPTTANALLFVFFVTSSYYTNSHALFRSFLHEKVARKKSEERKEKKKTNKDLDGWEGNNSTAPSYPFIFPCFHLFNVCVEYRNTLFPNRHIDDSDDVDDYARLNFFSFSLVFCRVFSLFQFYYFPHFPNIFYSCKGQQGERVVVVCGVKV